MSELNNKVANATKWSAITEIVAKLVTPITSMVLARLLTPEAFGVVATLTMVISFAELFTDAGFQKYLVQHEFKDEKERDEHTNVAFWSNFILSMLLWGIIAVFSKSIATLVGNPGLNHVLIIACVGIPIAAFSSIQMALYRRDLNFKMLFKVRIVSVLIPLFITIPLAYWLRSYWALILGSLTQQIANAVLLTVFSNWKPRLFYSFKALKEMLSFTLWSLFEAISIWLTGYIDIFIVGTTLSAYYLGLYTTSSTVVGQIIGMITAAITPVLFSSLSRLQSDKKEFDNMFYRFQKLVAFVVVPISFLVFCFSDFITEILLGDQWTEAAGFIGLWGLTSGVTIVLSHFSSEVFRAKGLPKISVLAQWLHILALWPTVLIAVNYGFTTLYIARCIVRIELIVVNVILMVIFIKMSASRMILNVLPSCIASSAMLLLFLLPRPNGLLMTIIYVLVSLIVYFIIIMLFPSERDVLKNLKHYLLKR